MDQNHPGFTWSPANSRMELRITLSPVLSANWSFAILSFQSDAPVNSLPAPEEHHSWGDMVFWGFTE